MLFKRFKKPANMPEMQGENSSPSMPDGDICASCPSCKKTVFCADLENNLFVCPKCGYLHRIGARERIKMLTDEGSFAELFLDLASRNVIDFPDYDLKIKKAMELSGEKESVVCGTALICGLPVAIFVMEHSFMMGSMGCITGEKITLLFEYATKNKLPVVGVTVSGGARMQEGIMSLMQMAKTSAAIKNHSDDGGLYITLLTDPTTGGVTASFAMLGDIILSEPNALIGFAGPRVIEQTIRQKLPVGFQRAEFLLEKGFVDKVVPRSKQKGVICKLLKYCDGKGLKQLTNKAESSIDLSNFRNISNLNDCEDTLNNQNNQDSAFAEDSLNSSTLTPYQRVLAARKPNRLSGLDFINAIFLDFVELHGDRRFGDDKAIIAGLATLNGIAVTVIAQEKGKDTKDKLSRNFGCAHPEGYRKALRLMKQAEKFDMPIICFVDTAGAYCGIAAEERGQGGAIAENLAVMSNLKVPVISIFIGEGGSGGALALAVADQVWMLSNAVYSVISPEGCASILWKDDKKAADAALRLKMTAEDLKNLNVIDKIIPENIDKQQLFLKLKQEIFCNLKTLGSKSKQELVLNRYNRFRSFV